MKKNSKMRSPLKVGALAVGALLITTFQAGAAPIAIKDPGLEQQTGGSSLYWNGGINDPSPAWNNDHTAIIIQNSCPGSNRFLSLASNYGGLANTATQTTDFVVESAGQQLMLTVSVADAVPVPGSAGAVDYVGLINIQIGGLSVASNTLAQTPTAPSAGWVDAYATYTTTAADVGKAVGVQLGGPNYPQGGIAPRRYFDNVRLNVEAPGIAFSTFAFTLPAAATTSAGVYNSSNQLVRTLWRNVRYTTGIHGASWDGKLDSGAAAPTGQTYTTKVLSHDTQYVWEGVVGNTSASFNGTQIWRSFEQLGSHHSLAISGTFAILSIGYIEGATGCNYFNTSTPQSPNDATPRDFTVSWSHAATDGIRYYLANTGAGWDNNSGTWITAWNVASPGQQASFSSAGQRVSSSFNEVIYTSGIDISKKVGTSHDYDFCALNAATGLAVQTAGSVLAASHGPLNVVRLFHKTTGASMGSINITSPGAVAFAPNGDLWVITGTSVTRFAAGTLGSTNTAATTINGFSAPLNVAVHPSNNNIVLVADGGTSQQIKGYTSAGAAASGWSTPYGVAGGYETNGPAVTANKFRFGNAVPMAIQSDGSFWVGDNATQRYLHLSASRSYLNQIALSPTSYVATVDANNPNRVFNGYLEYSIDYTKPLLPGDPNSAGGNGSWTLVNNWAAGLPSEYLGGGFLGFNMVATLSSPAAPQGNGRTYGTMYNPNTGQTALVELPSNGTGLRFTGTELTGSYPPVTAYSFYGNGDLRYNALSNYDTPSGIQTIYKQALTGFDGSGNPLWGGPTVLATTTARAGEPYAGTAWPGSVFWQWPITSSNIVVSFDQNANHTGMHLGGVPVGGSSWAWQSSPSVSTNVPPDGLGSFDTGDGVTYAANKVLALGRNIVYGYHGEFWFETQMAQYMHFYDDGLFVGQFGTSGDFHGPGGGITPGFGGNAFSPTLTNAGGETYMWVNEEGPHGGIHRWHLAGANAIVEASGSGILPPSGGVPMTLVAPAVGFPTGLTASPGNAKVALSWQAASGASGYKLKYGTTRGGPYTNTVSGISGTTSTVTGLSNGTEYFFAASAVVGGVESCNSTEVRITPYDPTIVVQKAGIVAGGHSHFDDFSITSRNLAAGAYAVNIHHMYESFGNLSTFAIGSRGYITFNGGGSGVDYYKIPQPLTLTNVSGWSDVYYSSHGFLIDGVKNAQYSWGASYALEANGAGTVNINPGDTNWHYVTVFSPNYLAGSRNCAITLTPQGLTSPAATYAINDPGLGFGRICQFLFKGNVTLTFTGTSANLAALFFDDAPTPKPTPTKLTGTVIGTPGSWYNTPATVANVFDGDLETFFDAPMGSGAWAGLDLGSAHVVTKVVYCPRPSWADRMLGGIFQGANSADFSDAVTLATVTTLPAYGIMTEQEVSNGTAFRYVRYLSAPNGWGNVAEVEFR